MVLTLDNKSGWSISWATWTPVMSAAIPLTRSTRQGDSDDERYRDSGPVGVDN